MGGIRSPGNCNRKRKLAVVREQEPRERLASSRFLTFVRDDRLAYAFGITRYETFFQDQPPVMDADTMESLMNSAGVAYFLPEGIQAGRHAPYLAYAGMDGGDSDAGEAAGIVMLRGCRRRLA